MNPPLPQAVRPELTVVIVNFNNWPDVARLVETLTSTAEVRSARCDMVVVDNASDDAVPDDLARPRAGVRLVLRAENDGFAAGVNAGWRASRAPWLLLLNPDVIAGPGLLSDVLERLASRPGDPPGVVGFGLRNADGTRQPSVGADPSLWRSLREPFIPRSRRKYQAGWRTRAGRVPWVTGACALVDCELLAALNGMDEEFFLYYEEVALCRSARRLGRAVEYDPSIDVVHLRPLQNRPISPRMRIVTRHSKLLYFRKHLPRWQFLALTWLVAAEAWIRRRWADGAEASAWGVVSRLAAALRGGAEIRGREVLDWADAGVLATTIERGPRGPRRLQGGSECLARNTPPGSSS